MEGHVTVGKPEAQGCAKVGHKFGSIIKTAPKETAQHSGDWQKVEARSLISLSEGSEGDLEGPPVWRVVQSIPTPFWNLRMPLPQLFQAPGPIWKVPVLGSVQE